MRGACVVIAILALSASAARADDGTLDASFGAGGVLNPAYLESDAPDAALAVLRDDQSRFLVVTTRRDPFPVAATRDLDLVLYRLTPTGALDSSYGGGVGYVLVNLDWSHFGQARFDRQGRILVTGTIIESDMTFATLALLRLLPTGARDSSFTGGTGNDGISAFGFGSSIANRATAVALMPNDDLVLAGNIVNSSSDMFGARMAASDGAPVTSWGLAFGIRMIDVQPSANSATDTVVAAEGLPDGRLVLMGQSCSAALGCRPAAVRLDSVGQLDPTFCASAACMASSVTGSNAGKRVIRDPASSGVTITAADVDAALRDGNGRLLFAGPTTISTATSAPGLVARLLPDGDIDTAFGAAASLGFQSLAVGDAPVVPRSIAIDGNARIAVGGTSDRAGLRRALLARLLVDGALDGAFGVSGAVVEYFPTPASDDRSVASVLPDGPRILALGDRNGPTDRDTFLFRVSGILFGDGFE